MVRRKVSVVSKECVKVIKTCLPCVKMLIVSLCRQKRLCRHPQKDRSGLQPVKMYGLNCKCLGMSFHCSRRSDLVGGRCQSGSPFFASCTRFLSVSSSTFDISKSVEEARKEKHASCITAPSCATRARRIRALGARLDKSQCYQGYPAPSIDCRTGSGIYELLVSASLLLLLIQHSFHGVSASKHTTVTKRE